ncbi:hypothetical protein CHS0354_023220 [Potamilus streckersoni]|uniref:Uncharacterized protein n=1 Tax=Potamilus streckersoni TaxID=2493646 RepID=A0AAE0SJC9_9BIVA|nr:hypothetical protein CHS0354_023220 [Potamilus streckersoni]
METIYLDYGYSQNNNHPAPACRNRSHGRSNLGPPRKRYKNLKDRQPERQPKVVQSQPIKARRMQPLSVITGQRPSLSLQRPSNVASVIGYASQAKDSRTISKPTDHCTERIFEFK